MALDKAKAESAEDALADSVKAKVFQHYMDKSEVPWVRWLMVLGTASVASRISLDETNMASILRTRVWWSRTFLEQFPVLSHAGKFHAMPRQFHS